MTEDKQPNNGSQTISTGGGAFIPGAVKTDGGDFVGRDKIINQVGVKTLRDEQYQRVLDWDTKTKFQRGFSLAWSVSFRASDLAGRDLSGLNLAQIDLKGADLTGADLTGADLRGTNLSGANLSRTNLSGAILGGANLTDANLTDANLFFADLSGANLTNFTPLITIVIIVALLLTLMNVHSSVTVLFATICVLLGVVFGICLLVIMLIDNIFHKPTPFANTVIDVISHRLNLAWVFLSGARLTWTDLSGADLTNASLSYANLYKANLTGADLTDVDLISTELSEANLSWANLSGASLINANLSGADLSGTDLSGADLTTANFSYDGVTLSHDELHMFITVFTNIGLAKMTGVLIWKSIIYRLELYGGILRKANLSILSSGDSEVSDTNMSRAKYDSQTKWPEDFTPPSDTIKIEDEE